MIITIEGWVQNADHWWCLYSEMLLVKAKGRDLNGNECGQDSHYGFLNAKVQSSFLKISESPFQAQKLGGFVVGLELPYFPKLGMPAGGDS